MSLHPKIGESYKEIDKGWVKISGTWRDIASIFVKIGGTWRDGWHSLWGTILIAGGKSSTNGVKRAGYNINGGEIWYTNKSASAIDNTSIAGTSDPNVYLKIKNSALEKANVLTDDQIAYAYNNYDLHHGGCLDVSQSGNIATMTLYGLNVFNPSLTKIKNLRDDLRGNTGDWTNIRYDSSNHMYVQSGRLISKLSHDGNTLFWKVNLGELASGDYCGIAIDNINDEILIGYYESSYLYRGNKSTGSFRRASTSVRPGDRYWEQTEDRWIAGNKVYNFSDTLIMTIISTAFASEGLATDKNGHIYGASGYHKLVYCYDKNGTLYATITNPLRGDYMYNLCTNHLRASTGAWS